MRISDWSSDVCSSDLLHDYREVVPASDAGLALALSGDSEAAIYILPGAPRQKGADARTRQNLALALPLSGRSAQPRIVPATALPLHKTDGPMARSFTLASPTKSPTRASTLNPPQGHNPPRHP